MSGVGSRRAPRGAAPLAVDKAVAEGLPEGGAGGEPAAPPERKAGAAAQLGSTLEAIHGARLPAGLRRALLFGAVRSSMGLDAPPAPVDTSAIMVDHAHMLSILHDRFGAASIGTGILNLRKAGLAELAIRVRRRSHARHALAHTDLELLRDLMAATLPPRGGDDIDGTEAEDESEDGQDGATDSPIGTGVSSESGSSSTDFPFCKDSVFHWLHRALDGDEEFAAAFATEFVRPPLAQGVRTGRDAGSQSVVVHRQPRRHRCNGRAVQTEVVGPMDEAGEVPKYGEVVGQAAPPVEEPCAVSPSPSLVSSAEAHSEAGKVPWADTLDSDVVVVLPPAAGQSTVSELKEAGCPPPSRRNRRRRHGPPPAVKVAEAAVDHVAVASHHAVYAAQCRVRAAELRSRMLEQFSFDEVAAALEAARS